MVSIGYDLLLPPGVTFVLCAICLVTGGYLWFGKQPGTPGRVAAMLVLVLLLFNPSLLIEEREDIRDVAVVLVDETPSQRLAERQGTTDDILTALLEKLAAFSDVLDVRVERIAHQSLDESEKGSRIFDRLQHSVSDIPKRHLAGAILITDGQIHDVPETAGEAGFPAPIHGLLTGGKKEFDRRIEILRTTGYGLVGQEGEIDIIIHDEGFDGPPARVQISVDGKQIETRILSVAKPHKIFIPLAKRGETIVSLKLDFLPGELTGLNNHAVATINAVRDRLRVLLISGVPHPGERTWRNLLKADPSVDLVHFTILRPPDKQDHTPIHELSLIAFPTRELFETKLDDFDLIVFDRYFKRGVLPNIYLDNIVDYVKRGGALLEASGPGAAGPHGLYLSPLGALLPGRPSGAVLTKGFQPKLTEDGLRHPVTSRLPGGPQLSLDDKITWGRWFRQIELFARGGHVLMRGLRENPLLILNRVGAGRVAQLSSDHIWLWSHGFEGGGPYGEFIRRLSHWLMKEPDLEENRLQGAVSGNRLRVEMQSLLPADPVVKVTTPSGQIRDLALDYKGNGKYIAHMPVQDVGLYQLKEDNHSVFVPVGALNPREYMQVTASAEPLRPAIEAAGGRIYWAAEKGVPDIRLLTAGRRMGAVDWLGLRRNNDYRITGLDKIPLLPPGLILLIVVGLLIFAWRREST